VKEVSHVFGTRQPLAGRRRTAHRFANRLLHRLDLVTHAGRLGFSTGRVNSHDENENPQDG